MKILTENLNQHWSKIKTDLPFTPKKGDLVKLRNGMYAKIWDFVEKNNVGNPVTYPVKGSIYKKGLDNPRGVEYDIWMANGLYRLMNKGTSDYDIVELVEENTDGE